MQPGIYFQGHSHFRAANHVRGIDDSRLRFFPVNVSQGLANVAAFDNSILKPIPDSGMSERFPRIHAGGNLRARQGQARNLRPRQIVQRLNFHGALGRHDDHQPIAQQVPPSVNQPLIGQKISPSFVGGKKQVRIRSSLDLAC